jgi:quinol-cytochrome oxidoreductase complex cytochrome b subunit
MSQNPLARWLGERIPIPAEELRKPLREALPAHLKQWLWCLGGTPALLFSLQVVTGILLTFYYVPYPGQAFESVRHITFATRFGWFVRGLHQGAAQLMFLAVLLHMIRVFVTRSYRAPRELTWVFGMLLFLCTMGFGFTGYSLVYDQLSYWATTVGTNLIGAVPLVGQPMLWMLRGGPDVNPNTLSRLYDFHIGVLPTLFVITVVAHIVLIRLHGVAPLEGDKRTETYSFFPDHMLREAAVGLTVLLVLVVYVILSPPGMHEKANPMITPAHIRPEWYFFPSYRWIKMVPMMVGLVSSAFFVGCMVFWPWIDAAMERLAPGRKLGVMLGTAVGLFTLVLLVLEGLS